MLTSSSSRCLALMLPMSDQSLPRTQFFNSTILKTPRNQFCFERSPLVSTHSSPYFWKNRTPGVPNMSESGDGIELDFNNSFINTVTDQSNQI